MLPILFHNCQAQWKNGRHWIRMSFCKSEGTRKVRQSSPEQQKGDVESVTVRRKEITRKNHLMITMAVELTSW